eukprot:123720_1
MTTKETIIPLIYIAQNLEHANHEQLLTFSNQLLKILLNHQLQLLPKTLLTIICNNHMKFPKKEWYTLSHCISNEQYVVDFDQDKPDQKLNIFDLSEGILIRISQFLNLIDLHSLEKTCRELCSIARHPNSLYHLAINFNQFEDVQLWKNINHSRYLKIKSLKMYSLHYRSSKWDDEEYFYMSEENKQKELNKA